VTILTTILTGVLWLTCVLIVILVLLQTGKGGSLAGVFGGGGGADSLLGTRATSFLVKATVVLSVLFLVLCLLLNWLGATGRNPQRYQDVPGSPEDAPAEDGAGVTAEAPVPAAEGAKLTEEAPAPPADEALPGDGEAAPEGDNDDGGAGAEE
jgi:preprotein translocase subunit SecG